MELLLYAIFLLVITGITLLLMWIIKKLAYPIAKRYLHWRPILFLTIAYFIGLNVTTLSPLLKLSDKLFKIPAITRVLNMILPQRSFEIFYMILIILLLNLVVLIGSVLLLLLIKIIFKKADGFIDADELEGINRILFFPWIIVSKFYKKEDMHTVHLRRGVVNYGIWAKYLKYVFLALIAAEILVFSLFAIFAPKAINGVIYTLSKVLYMLPMAAYVLTQQIQFFFETEEDEDVGSYATMDVQSSLDGDVAAVLELYNRLFNDLDVIVYSEKCEKNAQSASMGLQSNDLGNKQLTDCSQPDALSVISGRIKKCGVMQCDEYQNAVIALLNGSSINVRDYISGEFLIYLCAYLNYFISEGQTALFLCENEQEVAMTIEILESALHRLNELYTIWDICSIEKAQRSTLLSILVCTYDDILNTDILKKRRDFTDYLFATVLLSGEKLITRDVVRVKSVFTRLKSVKMLKQFILMSDVDNDDLRSAFEMFAGVELLPFNHDIRLDNTGVMVWKEESCYKIQRVLGIGNSLSPHMGTALPLALVAAKNDLPEVYLVQDPDRGDGTFDDAMEMSSHEVVGYIGKNVNLQTTIRTKMTDVIDHKDIALIIAYDSSYNYLNTIRMWMKYGGEKGTILHIVSPSYMLREYLASDTKKMLTNNNEFDALIPHSFVAKTTQMALLLVDLSTTGITEEEIMKKSREYGWGYTDVTGVLRDCLQTFLHQEEVHNIFENFRFERDAVFDAETSKHVEINLVTLTDDVIRARLRERLAYAQVVYKGDITQSLPILKGNLYNYYLRGQYFSHDRYMYHITGIYDGKLTAQQQIPSDFYDYYQIASMQINAEDMCIVDRCVDFGYVDFNIYTGKVCRNIYGYIASNKANCFHSKENIQVFDMREDAISVTHGDVSMLEMSFDRAVAGEQAEKVAALFAFTLNELFKTLFPGNYQNLFALTTISDYDAYLDTVFSEGKDAGVENLVRSIIPNLTIQNSNKPDRLCIYVVEFSCVDFGMVQMLYNKRERVFKLLSEYLSWYVSDAAQSEKLTAESRTMQQSHVQESDVQQADIPQAGAQQVEADTQTAGAPEYSGNYLRFGAPVVPDIFDIEGLRNLLRQLVTEHNAVEERQDIIIEASTFCTFCNKPSLMVYNLDDGRKMCAHCKDHQLSQKDEIKQLREYIKTEMEYAFSIKLRDNMAVCFARADEIRNKFPTVNAQRVLGFYTPDKHQLWIESAGPSVSMQSTIAHELTHCWQFDNIDIRRVLGHVPELQREKARLLLLEGHAVYVEIEMMRRLQEIEFAQAEERQMLAREDEYGEGYRWIREEIDSRRRQGSHVTPFVAMQELCQDIIDGKETLPI